MSNDTKIKVWQEISPRARDARYQLGYLSALKSQEWGGVFKGDPSYQAGYTDGLSEAFPEPVEEKEVHRHP